MKDDRNPNEETHGSIKFAPLVFQVGFLIGDQSQMMDFGDHLSSENNQSDPVGDIGEVPHGWIIFKGFRCVGHDRQHADN